MRVEAVALNELDAKVRVGDLRHVLALPVSLGTCSSSPISPFPQV